MHLETRLEDSRDSTALACEQTGLSEPSPVSSLPTLVCILNKSLEIAFHAPLEVHPAQDWPLWWPEVIGEALSCVYSPYTEIQFGPCTFSLPLLGCEPLGSAHKSSISYFLFLTRNILPSGDCSKNVGKLCKVFLFVCFYFLR